MTAVMPDPQEAAPAAASSAPGATLPPSHFPDAVAFVRALLGPTPILIALVTIAAVLSGLVLTKVWSRAPRASPPAPAAETSGSSSQPAIPANPQQPPQQRPQPSPQAIQSLQQTLKTLKSPSKKSLLKN